MSRTGTGPSVKRLARRERLAAGFMAALVASAAGCSTTEVPGAEPTSTPEPIPTARTTVYPLAVTAWYAGFVLHVDAATAVLDPGGGSVEFAIRLESERPDRATLDAPVLLVVGGSTLEPRREAVLPDVDPGAIVPGSFIFDVGGGFDVTAAALKVGRTGEHEVVVPMGAAAGQPATYAPVYLDLGGRTTAGSLAVTIHAAELRADLPDWGLELPLTALALSLTYDASFRSDLVGGFAFTTANVGLVLPDGRTIAARTDGHSAPAVVINPGATATALTSRFEVPVPAAGRYLLVILNGTARGTIEFEIAGP